MNIRRFQIITLNTCLFGFFFLICFGFGYATLNRYDPGGLSFLSDYSQILYVIENGLTKNVHSEQLTTRIIVPYLAHLIYSNITELGSWNLASFAMLITSATFTSLTAVVIFNFANHLSTDVGKSVLASFLFITSFFTVNYTLVTTVDSAYIFFLSTYLIALHFEKGPWIVPIMILGCMTKEAFLPVASSFSLGFIFYSYLKSQVRINMLLPQVVAVISGLSTLILLDYLVKGKLLLPWDNLIAISSSNFNHPSTVDGDSNAIIESIRVIFSIGPLLVLTLMSLSKLPESLIWPGIFASIMVIVLGSMIGVGAIDYARFIFSVTAPVVCFASANSIIGVIKSSERANQNCQKSDV